MEQLLPSETLLDPVAIAQEADSLALEQVAGEKAAIATVADRSRELVFEIIVGLGFEDSEQLLVHDAITKTQEMHSHRMRLLANSGSICAAVTPVDVGGFYDGTHPYIGLSVLKSGLDQEITRVYRHETQHAVDGLPSDLDGAVVTIGALQDAVAKELQTSEGVSGAHIEVSISQTDVPDVTTRDFAERRAMEAEGTPPSGPYVEQHWEPTEKVRMQLESAGEDFDGAVRALVVHNDPTPMQRAFARALLSKAGLELPQAA